MPMEKIKLLSPAELHGHNLWAVQRFADDTKHMIEFVIWDSPHGHKGEWHRLFLTEEGYVRAKSANQVRQIKIKRHANVVEGHIIYDIAKKKHGSPPRRR